MTCFGLFSSFTHLLPRCTCCIFLFLQLGFKVQSNSSGANSPSETAAFPPSVPLGAQEKRLVFGPAVSRSHAA